MENENDTDKKPDEVLKTSPFVAELIGTLILVFSICIVVTSADNGNTSIKDISLVHFLVLGGLINSLGPVSGAHFNPAVTFQFIVFKQIPIGIGVFYIILQLIGSMLGALLAFLMLPATWIETTKLKSRMATNAINSDFNIIQGLVGEILVTFVLVLSIWGVAVQKQSNNVFASWCIAGVVATGVLLLGPITGNSLNPARSFGPALVFGSFDNEHWVFWIGPIVGGLLAGLLYKTTYYKEQTPFQSDNNNTVSDISIDNDISFKSEHHDTNADNKKD